MDNQTEKEWPYPPAGGTDLSALEYLCMIITDNYSGDDQPDFWKITRTDLANNNVVWTFWLGDQPAD